MWKSSVVCKSPLATELKRARTAAVSEQVRSGKRCEWIFPGATTETVKPVTFKRDVFDKICQRVGLGERKVKDLRHTYASLLLYHGKSLKYVQEMLGHHSIRITADTYSHLIKNPDHGTVNVLDDVATGE